MSKKNWTDIFKTDLLALIKTDKETGEELTIEEKNRKVGDMFFKGAWKEDGAAKWAFFEGKEAKNAETQEEQQDIEKLKVREVEPPKEALQKTRKIRPEEVVSITAIGRNLTSRYQTRSLQAPGTETSSSEISGKKTITWKEGQKIRVFFSEDNQSYQRVLSTILNRSADVEVIGYASNGMEAVEEIEKLQTPPHVILMDIAMPRLDGIQATKKLLENNPSLKIVILTAFGDKMNVVNAFRAGAIGYLRKDSGMAVILDSIKQVASGYPPPLQEDIAAYLLEGAEEAQAEKEFSDELQVVETTYVDKGEKQLPEEKEEIEEIEEGSEEEVEEEVEIEEVEVTEEEYIDELANEVIQELVELNIQQMDEKRLKEIIEGDTIKKITDKFISQFDEEEIPEGLTKEYLSEEVAKKIVLNFKNKLSGTGKEVTKQLSPIQEKILRYKNMVREKPEHLKEVTGFYEELKKSNPGNECAIEALGWSYIKQGLLDKGVREYLSILEGDILKKKNKMMTLFK